ncbi:ubiquitin carboxyl-terminal hydrolase, family 1 [Armillaria luteobubalina]|uniref:Ubiquitin carboxyl-terminal hydrolase n=1 Tax=Armillaria luteobubalina TaxID=153913 RepID=A0AA39QPL9_9AGAR|nr:ubiquitin carboxyl-terminal hydrolase, family 1 [Armillaria luteobubalina]
MTTLKQFPPLESDPEIFNELLHRLGVDTKLKFIDILSLDIDPDVPRPALALIFICPYNFPRKSDEEIRERVAKSPFDPRVFWIPQSIREACGLHAILHSVYNSDARKNILPNTPLSRLLERASTLTSSPEISCVLEEDNEIEEAHCSIGRQGSTPLPDASNNASGQYLAFVPLHEDKPTGKRVVYDIDGSRACRTDKELSPGQDALSEPVLELIREYIKDLGADGNLEFSLMALVKDNSLPESRIMIYIPECALLSESTAK